MSRNGHFADGIGAISRVREEFASRNGIIAQPDFSKVYIHPHQTERIARAYDSLPSNDPAAHPHFQQMLADTRHQFDRMTAPQSKGGLGMSVHVEDEDPYSGPEEMRNDVLNNNRIKVLSSAQTGGHPALGTEGNNMFRAVHDVFGHVGSGRGFDRHGEEAAFVSHARMFTPAARPALASETRGQNSSFIKNRVFPEQKIAKLPEVFTRPVPLVAGNAVGRRAALLQSRQFHKNQFGAE
jgi:hypothetical protein